MNKNTTKRVLILAVLVAAIVVLLFVLKPKQPRPEQEVVSKFSPTTNTTSVVKAAQARPASPVVAPQAKPISIPTNEPPDVLAATNIEQWKAMIPNLRKDSFLDNFWMTKERLKGVGSVVLKRNGQSIIYKTDFVDVNVWNDAGEILEATISTPKMDIVETRELGLKICKMFGFDAAKFTAWCNQVGNNWLDSPLYSVGDQKHFFKIRRSYNDKQPWVMIFGIQPEKTYSELMLKLKRQISQSSPNPSKIQTNFK